MTEPVKLLVWGIPAEIVREIGLRLRGVVISEFDNAQQMGRAVAFGDARLVLLSDALPAVDSIYVARRAKDTSDDVRIAFLISMQPAQFGFEKGAQIARDLAERFASESLTAIDGVAISEQLLGLRESLVGAPSPPPAQAT